MVCGEVYSFGFGAQYIQIGSYPFQQLSSVVTCRIAGRTPIDADQPCHIGLESNFRGLGMPGETGRVPGPSVWAGAAFKVWG
jgi:hypothetical protein